MPNRHFLRSDIFTVAMVYYFYFRLFPNELNSKKPVIMEAACENSLSFLFSSVFFLMNQIVKKFFTFFVILDTLLIEIPS